MISLTIKSLIFCFTLELASFVVIAGEKTGNASVTSAASFAPQIKLDDLKDLVTKKAVFLIDANSSSSYASGHIPGAIHYAKHEGKLSQVLPKDKAALIVAYCGGPLCTAWEDSAKEAKKLGYTNIRHLKEGIKGWKEAKLPTDA